MGLSPEESQRYARHIVLKGMGAPGQQRLKAARVLVIGAGGLGSPVTAYLAAAGIGSIGIVDHDHVSISNLQRQIVHSHESLDTNKALSAKAFVENLNPHVEVSAHACRLDDENGIAIASDYDIIVDGTDRFSARASIAAIAEHLQRPLVTGAVSMFDGQVTVLAPHLSDADGRPNPRFADLYPHTPDDASLPACEEVGVLGATTGVIGTLMAMEVIKIITGIGAPLIGRLLLYDGRNASFSELKYRRKS